MAKPGKAEKRAARAQRLSRALRENLKRRKAQARGRSVEAAAEGDEFAATQAVPRETPDFCRNRSRE